MSATVYRRSSNSPNSGGVGDQYIFSLGDFSKKVESHLKKAESPPKKRNLIEKRKTDIPESYKTRHHTQKSGKEQI